MLTLLFAVLLLGVILLAYGLHNLITTDAAAPMVRRYVVEILIGALLIAVALLV